MRGLCKLRPRSSKAFVRSIEKLSKCIAEFRIDTANGSGWYLESAHGEKRPGHINATVDKIPIEAPDDLGQSDSAAKPDTGKLPIRRGFAAKYLADTEPDRAAVGAKAMQCELFVGFEMTQAYLADGPGNYLLKKIPVGSRPLAQSRQCPGCGVSRLGLDQTIDLVSPPGDFRAGDLRLGADSCSATQFRYYGERGLENLASRSLGKQQRIVERRTIRDRRFRSGNRLRHSSGTGCAGRELSGSGICGCDVVVSAGRRAFCSSGAG